MALKVFGTIDSSLSGSRRRPATRRVFLLCICLALAVTAANVVYSALSSPSEALTGAAGELLYVSTFSRF